MKLECDQCLNDVEFTTEEGQMICPNCGYVVIIATETIIINDKSPQTHSPSVEVLEEGTVVIVDNANHIWHNEVAIIRSVKHKFYRIEFLGRQVWVPYEWVKKHEPN